MKISSLRLSHSTMNKLHSCARKLEFVKFHKHYGWEESLPAECGKALHAGYQSYLVNYDKELAIFEMMCAYPSTLNVVPTGLQVRSIESMYATLIEMFNHSIMGESELARISINGELRPAIEVSFQINFKNFSLNNNIKNIIPVFYVGFIDFILYDIRLDKYTVVDVKSHRANQSDINPKFQFDDQCLPYALVLEQILGHPVNNLEVIYLAAYVDLEFPRVQKFIYTKSEQDISDWTKNMYMDLIQIKTYYENQWFPRRGSSCFGFNKPCAHFEYCGSRDDNTISLMLENAGAKKEENKIDPWITIDLDFAPF